MDVYVWKPLKSNKTASFIIQRRWKAWSYSLGESGDSDLEFSEEEKESNSSHQEDAFFGIRLFNNC